MAPENRIHKRRRCKTSKILMRFQTSPSHLISALFNSFFDDSSIFVNYQRRACLAGDFPCSKRCPPQCSFHFFHKTISKRTFAQQSLRCCYHQPIEPAFPCLPVLKRVASSAATLRASWPFSKSISRGRSPSGQSFMCISFTYQRFNLPRRLDDQPRPFPLPPPYLPIRLSFLLPLPPQPAPLCDWSNLPCSIPVFTSVTTL